MTETARRGPRCGDCRFYITQGHEIEKSIPGLSSLGSAFGDHIGDSRLCVKQDCLVSPQDSCSWFQAAAMDIRGKPLPLYRQ